jgi:hypothetical protein
VIERLEVTPGPGTVIRYGGIVAWADPSASAALISFLAQSARNLSPSPRGGRQIADHIASVLATRDPEPHVAFAVIGPSDHGWASLLHGPVQVWDGARWLAPTPTPGWLQAIITPRPAITVGAAGTPTPAPEPDAMWDLEAGVVPGSGFLLVPSGVPGRYAVVRPPLEDHLEYQRDVMAPEPPVEPAEESGPQPEVEPVVAMTTALPAVEPTQVLGSVGAGPERHTAGQDPAGVATGGGGAGGVAAAAAAAAAIGGAAGVAARRRKEDADEHPAEDGESGEPDAAGALVLGGTAAFGHMGHEPPAAAGPAQPAAEAEDRPGIPAEPEISAPEPAPQPAAAAQTPVEPETAATTAATTLKASGDEQESPSSATGPEPDTGAMAGTPDESATTGLEVGVPVATATAGLVIGDGESAVADGRSAGDAGVSEQEPVTDPATGLEPAVPPVPTPRRPPIPGPAGSVDLRTVATTAGPPLPRGGGPDQRVPGAPVVAGALCARGHLNRPGLTICARCRTPLRAGSDQVSGTRPPLGVLVGDDGIVYRLDRGYLVGSDPGRDPTVGGGLARPLTLRGSDVSGSHAELRLADWDVLVVDRGSAAGTCVYEPGAAEWARLNPFEPRALAPGTHVAFGQRVVTFLSPWVAQG